MKKHDPLKDGIRGILELQDSANETLQRKIARLAEAAPAKPAKKKKKSIKSLAKLPGILPEK